MTHEEFVNKLNRFFTIEQIEALERYGHWCAMDVFEGEEEVTSDDDLLWFIGREYVCTYLWDCEDVEEVNSALPDKIPMSEENFANMANIMDAFGQDKW